MKKYLLILIIIMLLCCQTLYSQQNNPCLNKQSFLLDISKPSVYITFEKLGNHNPRNKAESKEGVWLRIYNNSKYAISVLTEGSILNLTEANFEEIKLCSGIIYGIKDGNEIDPYYFVKATRGNAPEQYFGHNIFADYIKIPSGRTAIFSVPKEFLKRFLSIDVKITYEFEWEMRKDQLVESSNNIKHEVYFYSYQLPDEIFKEINPELIENRINGLRF